jgi:hypothetical protein
VKPVEPEHPTLTVNQRLKMEVGHFGVSGGEGELGPFLRSRNIYSPVHYVLCEGDTLPQLLPQVLTDSPGIEAMVPACSGSLGFEGLEPKGTRGQVYGVALTPAGYEAILADVATFYTGEPTGLFVSGTSPDGRLLEEMAAMPRSKSGAKLTALADIQTPQDVVPLPEASVPSEPRRLLESDDFGSVRAPPARVIRLDFPGQGGAVQRIPTGTCEELVVRTKAPRLVKSSIVELGVTPFLTVEVTGCGQDRMLFTVPYVDGVHPVHRRPAGVDVAVRLGVESTAGYRRVYSAEIGYR